MERSRAVWPQAAFSLQRSLVVQLLLVLLSLPGLAVSEAQARCTPPRQGVADLRRHDQEDSDNHCRRFPHRTAAVGVDGKEGSNLGNRLQVTYHILKSVQGIERA